MKIKIHWSLIVFLLFYALTGMLFELLIIFLIVFLHEISHLIVAKGYKYTINELVLYPFGGKAVIEELIESDPGPEERIALAGPFFNILLALIGLIAYQNDLIARTSAEFFIRANFILALFNLLPALPLDGGRVLRARLARRIGFRLATEKACLMGKILAIMMCFVGLLGLYWQFLNLSIFLVAFFLFFAAANESKRSLYIYYSYLTKKKRKLQSIGAVNCQELLAFEDVEIKHVTKLFRPNKYHLVTVMDRNWDVKGRIGEKEILDILLSKGANTRISKLL